MVLQYFNTSLLGYLIEGNKTGLGTRAASLEAAGMRASLFGCEGLDLLHNLVSPLDRSACGHTHQ